MRYGRLGWWAGYKITNGPTAARVAMLPMYHALFKSGMKRILRAFHDVDLIVCVHSVFVRPTVRALIGQERRPPILTIVTDLVSTHMWWYDPHVDRCLVPTEAAYERGLRAGLTPKQMRITGLPVHPRFAEGLMDKAEARAALGWDADLPAVLVIGGGAGMGPLYAIARAINAKGARCQLAVVAGRNESLKARLDAATWRQPTHIYPYVHNMPTMMAAADILVTKAGPGTISEACIAGVPIVLSGAIPGQEEGNITFVVRNGAGVWAPGPHRVADAVASWLAEGREGLARRAAAAKALGRPNAVWEIAEEVRHYASQPRVIVDERGNRRTALLPHAGSRS
ncbi:MAG: hypothetical protein Kow00120_20660 [Anaerolineae bacterium]